MFFERLTGEQKKMLLGMAYSVAVSDGEMSEEEKSMLARIGHEMNIGNEHSFEYVNIESVRSLFKEQATRTIALITLIKIGFADQAYEIEEQCYIDDIRRELGFSDGDFNRITDWVKRLVSLEGEIRKYLGNS